MAAMGRPEGVTGTGLSTSSCFHYHMGTCVVGLFLYGRAGGLLAHGRATRGEKVPFWVSWPKGGRRAVFSAWSLVGTAWNDVEPCSLRPSSWVDHEGSLIL
jgi:hypothetical protein